ncbi:MAG: hypothetical protein M3Y59_12740 [Myxococcota bacterium]|nr:hypothetical protein [Myxococcota bacterium]
METRRPEETAPDVLTVLAIATTVYVLAKVIHEGLGHGLTCVLEGGRLVGVSSAFAQCDLPGQTVLQRRLAVASGTLLNLAVAALAFSWLRLRAPRTLEARYALWLTAAVNGLMGSGYLMVDPLFGFGDWTVFLSGLEPRWAYRIGFAAIGSALTLRWFFLLYPALGPLLAGADNLRQQARRLCLLPWAVVGGGVMTAGALLNYLGPVYAFTSGLATVGGTFLLVWIPTAIPKQPSTEPALPSGRIGGWRLAGAAALLFLLLGLGPGFRF